MVELHGLFFASRGVKAKSVELRVLGFMRCAVELLGIGQTAPTWKCIQASKWFSINNRHNIVEKKTIYIYISIS